MGYLVRRGETEQERTRMTLPRRALPQVLMLSLERSSDIFGCMEHRDETALGLLSALYINRVHLWNCSPQLLTGA